VATQFDVSLNAVTYFLRVAVFVAPVLAFLITKRICIGLQRADRDRMLHGAESGVIDRAPSGQYSERHRSISQGQAFTLTQHEDMPALLPMTDVDGMSVKEIKSEQRRRKATRFYFIDTLRRPTRAELEEAAAHHMHPMAIEGDGEHHAIEPVEEEEHHLAK
jgi:ubiquinol-cytochrome c reductase cytochrome b subunit